MSYFQSFPMVHDVFHVSMLRKCLANFKTVYGSDFYYIVLDSKSNDFSNSFLVACFRLDLELVIDMSLNVFEAENQSRN